MAVGALILKFVIVEARQDEFLYWHTHNHIPSRLALPGFKRVQRWRSKQNQNKFLCIYDLEYPYALYSSSYQKLVHAKPSKEEIDLKDAFSLCWRAECEKVSSNIKQTTSLIALYEIQEGLFDKLPMIKVDDSVNLKIFSTSYVVKNFVCPNNQDNLTELIVVQWSKETEDLIQTSQYKEFLRYQKPTDIFQLDFFN